MNWSTIIWIAVAVILYLVGIYEGRGQGYIKRKAEDDKEKRDKALAPIKPITADDPGVMRIKNENGQLALDLDGARVDTNSFSADQRKRLIEIISSVRPWLESKSAPVPITNQPQPQQLQSIAPPPPVQPINPPTPINPLAPKPATIAKEDRPSTPATSMIGQIDSILQEHLAGTPLEERDVFLKDIRQIVDWSASALKIAKDYTLSHMDVVASFAAFDSNHLSIVRADGAYEIYDGGLRATDAQGKKIFDHEDNQKYAELIAEEVKPWSYMKFPFIR